MRSRSSMPMFCEPAKLTREMCGSSTEIIMHLLPEDDPTRRCPDITCATKLLGWMPTVPPAVGLERTIADFRSRDDE